MKTNKQGENGLESEASPFGSITPCHFQLHELILTQIFVKLGLNDLR